MSSQQAALDKEAARIRLKREANAARAERFLDARQRTLGLDLQALDAQVAEKKRNTASDQENSRLERLRAKEIDRVLEVAAEEEHNMRRYQMQQLKQTWEAQKSEKSGRPVAIDYEPEKFGPSSFQVFDGEDVLAEERASLKKDQMRRWTQEQIAEHAVQRKQMKDDDMAQADLIRQIDYVRGQAEDDERHMHALLKKEVAQENQQLSASRRAALEKSNYERQHMPDGRALTTSLRMPEDMEVPAVTEDGVLRKDLFRGYTPAQRRKLLQENETLRAAKEERVAAELRYEAEWAVSQAAQKRAMEQAHYEELLLKKYQQEKCQETLLQQVEEQREVRLARDAQARGEIAPEFFQNFGRSCR